MGVGKKAEKEGRPRPLWLSLGGLVAGTGALVLGGALAVRSMAGNNPWVAWLLLASGLVAMGMALLLALPALRARLGARRMAAKRAGAGGRMAGVALALVSTLGTVAFLELTIRGYRAVSHRLDQENPLHIVCDPCPELYRLNPEHPLVGPDGLRGAPVQVPKPEGVFRVLVLGDSVSYGPLVAEGSRFTEILEDHLAGQAEGLKIEVVNAGVSGYTTYNEVQLFRRLGPELQPDLVLLAFVMNDVANPRLHWGYTRRAIRRIPPEAIPNPAYDRKKNRLWRNLHLFRIIQRRARAILPAAPAGDAWPTRITGEDSLSIEVLLDPDSSEWSWLRGQLEQLHDLVVAGGGHLALVVLPLAYQLEEGYPYRPQALMMDYCRERGLRCLDLLPSFSAGKAEELFLGERSGYWDVWHLTEEGHELTAAELAAFLLEGGLVPELG